VIDTAEQTDVEQRRGNRRTSIWSEVVALGLLIACGVTITAAASHPIDARFSLALDQCGVHDRLRAVVSAQGRALFLDTAGETRGNPGLEVGDTQCVLAALQVPDSVLQRMASENEGEHSAMWAGLEANWTHKPGTGLDVQLTF
jgi:hypothetical protein